MVALIVFLVLVVAVGALLVVFRRQVGVAIGAVQSRIFGSFGRRAARSSTPMLIVVGVGFVLIALVAVVCVVLAAAYPNTFHLEG